ncbi:MAG: L,D-transpeptidase family protein [Gammaproteobacteria bacterium]|nr:L,D-transpeptidase family protein [Gammaproteobacteria bacterium]
MKKLVLIVFMFCSALFCGGVWAATYQIPSDGSDVVGELKIVQSQKNDTLNRIAIRNGVGYNEIVRANPSLSKNRKLPIGTDVTIPTAFLLPDTQRNGIIINLSAMRLYYFPDESTVITHPVAVGKRGWSTPQGVTKVIAKKRNPTWTPPKSIIREAARRGKKLRRVYPAGPNNPLGTRALRLGIPGYLIHGTNKPWSIGKRRSHGCIRMRRDDVESLFSKVPVGTRVQIISQPFEIPSLAATRESSKQISDDSIIIDDTPKQVRVQKKRVKARYLSGVRVKRSISNQSFDKPENFQPQVSNAYYNNHNDNVSYASEPYDAQDQGYQNLTDGDAFTNSFD